MPSFQLVLEVSLTTKRWVVWISCVKSRLKYDASNSSHRASTKKYRFTCGGSSAWDSQVETFQSFCWRSNSSVGATHFSYWNAHGFEKSFCQIGSPLY